MNHPFREKLAVVADSGAQWIRCSAMLAVALPTRRQLEEALHATNVSTHARRSSHEPTGRPLFA